MYSVSYNFNSDLVLALVWIFVSGPTKFLAEPLGRGMAPSAYAHC